jgi:hypothetical protein
MESKWVDLVNDRLKIILEEAIFDERTEQIFKWHYGVECQRLDLKAISKGVKMPIKKLKLEVVKIDNKVFNILKKHNFLEE